MSLLCVLSAAPRTPAQVRPLARRLLSMRPCADALLQIVESGTKNVILGHLSGENNTPSLAYHISEDRMTREGIRLGQDLTLDVALRDRVGNIYTLGDGK